MVYKKTINVGGILRQSRGDGYTFNVSGLSQEDLQEAKEYFVYILLTEGFKVKKENGFFDRRK